MVITLEPEDYMFNDNTNNGMCLPGIGDHGGDFGWSIGINFLKRFVVVYNFAENKIAFVRASY